MKTKPVRVTKIEASQVEVTIATPANCRAPQVFVNGISLGYVCPQVSYPSSVTIYTIHTDDGQEYSLADHRVPYRVLNREVGGIVRLKKTSGKRLYCQKVEIPCGVKLTYKTVGKLKVGDVVAHQYPFALRKIAQGNHGQKVLVLTNQKLAFPVKRPQRAEWENWSAITFVQPIKAENWYLMLKALHGLCFEEKVLNLGQVREQMKAGTRANNGTHRQRPAGQCFDGRSAETVAIGENLIFCLPATTTKTAVYIVDSPEPARALYIFEEYADAYAWASRSIDYTEARTRAQHYFYHSGDWQSRISAYV